MHSGCVESESNKSRKYRGILIVSLITLLVIVWIIFCLWPISKLPICRKTTKVYLAPQRVASNQETTQPQSQEYTELFLPKCKNSEKLIWTGEEFKCLSDQTISHDFTVDKTFLNLTNNYLSFKHGEINDGNICRYSQEQGLVCDISQPDIQPVLELNENVLSIEGGNSVTFTNWDTNVEDDVKRLNDLLDVNTAYPTNYDVLIYLNGYWQSRELKFIDLADTPNSYGSNGYILTTDGHGRLRFTSPSDINTDGYWTKTSNGWIKPKDTGTSVYLEDGEKLGIGYVPDTFGGGAVMAINGGLGVGTWWLSDGAKLEIKGMQGTKAIQLGERGTNGLDTNNFVGMRVYWDTDNLQIGLRDYGSDRKDAVFNIEQSSDNFRFQANGNDLFFIQGTGEVGINTTSPQHLLHIVSNSGSDGIIVQNTGGKDAEIILSTNPKTWYIFVDGNGSDSGTGDLDFYTADSIDNNLQFRLVFKDSGEVGIATKNPGALLQVGENGDGSYALANAWNTFSDVRLKENITPITGALSKINQLQGVEFTWKNSKDKDLGLVAQEVQKVFPEIVKVSNTGYLSLDYSKLIPVLIQAVKELDTKCDNELKGTAIIKAGKSQIYIPISNMPTNSVIIATPYAPNHGFYVTQETNGFTIHLMEPASKDIKFSWIISSL